MTDKCPIWGTDAKLVNQNGDNVRCTSPRAGGQYELTGSALSMLSDLSDEERIRVTNAIVDQNRIGIKTLTISSNDLNRLRKNRAFTVMQRRDRLLMYLDYKILHIGSGVPISGLITEELLLAGLQLLAWTASFDNGEYYYLINQSEQAGLVERRNDQIYLTTEGYKYLQGLAARQTASEQAFVAMWFHKSMDKHYQEGIAPAIKEAGYRPLRIDQKEHVNKIDDEIIAEIRRSRFLVADFTSEPEKPRGGVYFETGFAQGLNIPVIWMCRKDMIDDVHFDTRQFNHIDWSDTKDLYTRLKDRIGAVIGDGPLK